MNNNQLNKLAQNSIVQNEPEPMIVGGERLLNPSEKVIVDERKPMIDKAKADIDAAQQDLITIGNTAALVQAELVADAQAYDQKHSQLVQAIDDTKKKLSGIVKRIEKVRSLNDNNEKEDNAQRRKGESNSRLGIWIILACLVFDLVSLAVTWSQQREVFGMATVRHRALYVAGVFGISLFLHFLLSRNGLKLVLICLVASLFMSVVVAGHTLFIVYSTDELETVGDYSLDLVDSDVEPTPVPQKSMLERMAAEPGLLEFCFMLLLLAVAAAKSISEDNNKKSAKATVVPDISGAMPDTVDPSACLLSPLNTSKMELELKLISQEEELAALENHYKDKVAGCKERLNGLSEESNEQKKILMEANKTIEQQFLLILQSLMAFKAVYQVTKAIIDDVPESSLAYPAVTETDLRRHFGMSIHNNNYSTINI